MDIFIMNVLDENGKIFNFNYSINWSPLWGGEICIFILRKLFSPYLTPIDVEAPQGVVCKCSQELLKNGRCLSVGIILCIITNTRHLIRIHTSICILIRSWGFYGERSRAERSELAELASLCKASELIVPVIEETKLAHISKTMHLDIWGIEQ